MMVVINGLDLFGSWKAADESLGPVEERGQAG
jgi:hypothetical protein